MFTRLSCKITDKLEHNGTIYLRARYYNPSIGRFISRDSFAGKKSDPLSLNLYTYCANNPIVYIDPSGHFKMPKWAKSVGNWFGERVDDWKVGAGIIEDETKDAASYVNQKVIRPTIKKTVAVATSLKNKTSKALSSAKKGICNAAPEICAGVKSFVKNTFGAEYTMASEIGYSTDIFPLGSPIQISASQKGTEIIEKIGDSSKPISVYTRSVYDGDVTHNTAGLKINICGATANFSFGLRNIGATVSVTNNNNTYFGGLNASICDLDVSANGGTTTRITDTSSYTQAGKISVNAMLIVAAYCYMQGAPFEMPSSSPVPGY